MQSTLAYEITGLEQQSVVNAFCIDAQTGYVAQTINQDTVITKCDLDESKATAVATSDRLILPNLTNVHSLSLITSTPNLTFMLCGQPVDANGEVNAPEIWHLTLNQDDHTKQPTIFKITHLESANITGTPLPEPVIGAVSALSSNHDELAVLVLDKAQHLQCTVFNIKQVSHLVWQMMEKGETTIEAGDLKLMATVYQSFKPTEKQLAPETIGSIRSIAFSNGRAIYATKSFGDQRAVSKGFWLLKNGFQDQLVDLPADAELTGIMLLGKYVYFGASQSQSNHQSVNQIYRVEKSLWS